MAYLIEIPIDEITKDPFACAFHEYDSRLLLKFFGAKNGTGFGAPRGDVDFNEWHDEKFSDKMLATLNCVLWIILGMSKPHFHIQF